MLPFFSPQSVCCGFISERGQRIHSIAILTLFLFYFFLSLRSWVRWSRVKVPEERSRGDGGTASTSLMPGVGGIQLGRHTMESQAEDGDASSGLSQDSALFSGSCIPAISVIISKWGRGKKKKLNLLPFSKWTCPAPQGKHSHLWVLVAGWVLMRQVKCVWWCVCVVYTHVCVSAFL